MLTRFFERIIKKLIINKNIIWLYFVMKFNFKLEFKISYLRKLGLKSSYFNE